MNIKMRLEIDYHQQDQASLFLESSNSNQEELFGEILLFCCFTLRVLVNLGQSQVASSLATLLLRIEKNLSNINEFDGPDWPEIVEYKGTSGRKQFIANLKYSDNSFNFNLDTKGFGLLGRGIDYYAPNSVFLLLKYLAKRRFEDKNYITNLAQAAIQCGQVFYSGRLTVINQSQVALYIAGSVMGSQEVDNTSIEKISDLIANDIVQLSKEMAKVYVEEMIKTKNIMIDTSSNQKLICQFSLVLYNYLDRLAFSILDDNKKTAFLNNTGAALIGYLAIDIYNADEKNFNEVVNSISYYLNESQKFYGNYKVMFDENVIASVSWHFSKEVANIINCQNDPYCIQAATEFLAIAIKNTRYSDILKQLK
jgi:hypothetical protein